MKLNQIKIPGVGSGSLTSPGFWVSIIGGLFALLVAWGAATWLRDRAGEQVSRLRGQASAGAGNVPTL